MQLLAANNAQTVLASGINASATTLTLATGGGALFPTPVTGTSLFKLTLLDAATETQNEIVHVTSVSGDTFTIVRAQEGTVARSWSANDIAMCAVTAGTLDFFAQLDSPTFSGNPQGPTRPVGDNTNSLATTAFTQAAIQAWGVGVSGSSAPTYAVKPVSGTSTSPTQIINTLTTDVQATVQAPVSGERFGGWSIARDLRPAQMGVSGSGATASYWYRGFSATSAVQGDWKQLADIASPAFTGTPTAPTAAPGTNTTQIASTAFVQNAFSGITGRLINIAVFPSSGTFTPNPLATKWIVEAFGGGAGGRSYTSSVSYQVGGGGGAGGYFRGQITTMPSSVTVTIGAGGAADANGGSTTFGALITAAGGFTGTLTATTDSSAAATAGGGAGGTYTFDSVNVIMLMGSRGGPGGLGVISGSAGAAGNGGNSFSGGGAQGPSTSSNIVGNDGAQYGGGGSGAIKRVNNSDAGVGGVGAKGYVIVYEYA